MKTEVVKRYGSFVVQFTQGVQTFHIPNLEKTKKHAIWQKEMLDKAFKNYEVELLKSFQSQSEQPAPIQERIKPFISDQEAVVSKWIREDAEKGKTEQPVSEEEMTHDEEKILILFNKHSNCLGKSPIKLPCMTRSAFVTAVQEYAQSHPIELRKELKSLLVWIINEQWFLEESNHKECLNEYLKSSPESKVVIKNNK